MLDEEEYSSDTSDEDFVPGGIESGDDEEISEEEDKEDNNSENEDINSNSKRKKKQKNGKLSKKKQKKMNPLLASIVEVNPDPTGSEEAQEDPVEDNKKEDELWADFLSDVEEKKPEKPKPKTSWSALLGNRKKRNDSLSPSGEVSKEKIPNAELKKLPNPEPKTVKVTKVFEFAGEEVRVEEEVPADSLQSQSQVNSKGDERTTSSNNLPVLRKSSGLSGIVNLIGNKNQKLSTLEKSKLDWMKFKSSEGIEDELQTHLKSKDGYLEKKEFLERADIREFEIEKEMRMKKRSNR